MGQPGAGADGAAVSWIWLHAHAVTNMLYVLLMLGVGVLLIGGWLNDIATNKYPSDTEDDL